MDWKCRLETGSRKRTHDGVHGEPRHGDHKGEEEHRAGQNDVAESPGSAARAEYRGEHQIRQREDRAKEPGYPGNGDQEVQGAHGELLGVAQNKKGCRNETESSEKDPETLGPDDDWKEEVRNRIVVVVVTRRHAESRIHQVVLALKRASPYHAGSMQEATAPPEELIDLIRTAAVPMEPVATSVHERCQRLPAVRAVLFDIYGTLLISSSGDIGAARIRARRRAFQDALEATFDGSRGHGDRADGGATAALAEPAEAAELAEKTYFAAIEGIHTDKHSAGLAHPEVEIREVWAQVVEALRAGGYLSEGHPTDTVATEGPGTDGGVSDVDIERLAVRYEGLTNPTWPMPEMETTVRVIAEAVPVGIVSNAQFFTPLLFPALVGASLDELGVRPDLCAYSYLAGEAKPSPALFEHVLATLRREYGVAADEVLYVGNDMLNDIWAANECGLKTCLFAGDERSLRLREDEPVAAATTPTCVVRSLPAIPPILGIGEPA